LVSAQALAHLVDVSGRRLQEVSEDEAMEMTEMGLSAIATRSRGEKARVVSTSPFVSRLTIGCQVRERGDGVVVSMTKGSLSWRSKRY
jgi:hypothetical protein